MGSKKSGKRKAPIVLRGDFVKFAEAMETTTRFVDKQKSDTHKWDTLTDEELLLRWYAAIGIAASEYEKSLSCLHEPNTAELSLVDVGVLTTLLWKRRWDKKGDEYIAYAATHTKDPCAIDNG
jgi:hypothetical protein